MVMKGKGGNGEIGGEISKMDEGVGGIVPRIYGRERITGDKLRGMAGWRAWGFEKRLSEGRGELRKCLEEMRVRFVEEKYESEWEQKRKVLFGRRGIRIREIEGGAWMEMKKIGLESWDERRG